MMNSVSNLVRDPSVTGNSTRLNHIAEKRDEAQKTADKTMSGEPVRHGAAVRATGGEAISISFSETARLWNQSGGNASARLINDLYDAGGKRLYDQSVSAQTQAISDVSAQSAGIAPASSSTAVYDYIGGASSYFRDALRNVGLNYDSRFNIDSVNGAHLLGKDISMTINRGNDGVIDSISIEVDGVTYNGRASATTNEWGESFFEFVDSSNNVVATLLRASGNVYREGGIIDGGMPAMADTTTVINGIRDYYDTQNTLGGFVKHTHYMDIHGTLKRYFSMDMTVTSNTGATPPRSGVTLRDVGDALDNAGIDFGISIRIDATHGVAITGKNADLVVNRGSDGTVDSLWLDVNGTKYHGRVSADGSNFEFVDGSNNVVVTFGRNATGFNGNSLDFVIKHIGIRDYADASLANTTTTVSDIHLKYNTGSELLYETKVVGGVEEHTINLKTTPYTSTTTPPVTPPASGLSKQDVTDALENVGIDKNSLIAIDKVNGGAIAGKEASLSINRGGDGTIDAISMTVDGVTYQGRVNSKGDKFEFVDNNNNVVATIERNAAGSDYGVRDIADGFLADTTTNIGVINLAQNAGDRAFVYSNRGGNWVDNKITVTPNASVPVTPPNNINDITAHLENVGVGGMTFIDIDGANGASIAGGKATLTINRDGSGAVDSISMEVAGINYQGRVNAKGDMFEFVDSSGNVVAAIERNTTGSGDGIRDMADPSLAGYTTTIGDIKLAATPGDGSTLFRRENGAWVGNPITHTQNTPSTSSQDLTNTGSANSSTAGAGSSSTQSTNNEASNTSPANNAPVNTGSTSTQSSNNEASNTSPANNAPANNGSTSTQSSNNEASNTSPANNAPANNGSTSTQSSNNEASKTSPANNAPANNGSASNTPSVAKPTNPASYASKREQLLAMREQFIQSLYGDNLKGGTFGFNSKTGNINMASEIMNLNKNNLLSQVMFYNSRLAQMSLLQQSMLRFFR